MTRSAFIRLSIIVAAIATGACFKEYSENFQEEETIIENAAIGQQDADDALDMAYRAEVYQRLHPGDTVILNGCAKIYDDPANHLLTINFGAVACNGFLNHTQTGKILIAYEGALGDTTANRTLTFDAYTVQDLVVQPNSPPINKRKVEGTVFLHNRILNESNLPQDDRTLTDFKITFPNGTGITFDGIHTRVWTSGKGDTLEYNNIYAMYGSISGSSSSGRNFTQNITTPLKLDFYCATSGGFARTLGVVDLSKLDGYADRLRSVDYGDSTCNKTVTVKTFRRTYGVSTN